MNGFDAVLIAVILLSALVAAAHGFFSEIFSLAGALFGFLLASWEYWRLAPWFGQYTKSATMANAAAFLAIVVAVSILASIAAKITTWAMKEVGLRWADRMLGGAFGLFRGLVLGTILVLIATSFTPDAPWLQQSRMAGYLSVSAHVAIWVAPAGVRDRFNDGVAYLRKAREEALAKVERSQTVQKHD